MGTIMKATSTRSFSLGIYLLIVFSLSWPFQIAGAIWGTSFLSVLILNSISMIMVTVGTYIAGRYVFRDGFAKAGWRWGSAGQHLAVIGLALLLWVIPTLVRFLLGDIAPGGVDKSNLYLLLVLPLVTLIPGFGEEFGWRGYMLPHLARRMTARKAVSLHSVIWWAWHLPVLVGAGVKTGIASAAQASIPVGLSVAVSVAAVVIASAVPAILHGVVFAYIWTRSQSLAVATVYHAAYDGLRDSLSLITGVTATVSLWANVVLVILGIVFLWKGNWKNLTALQSPVSSSNSVSKDPGV